MILINNFHDFELVFKRFLFFSKNMNLPNTIIEENVVVDDCLIHNNPRTEEYNGRQ